MPLISLFARARGDDTVAVVVSCLSEVRRAVSRTCYPQFALWKIPQSSEVCPPTNQLRNFHDLGRILPCPSSLSGRSRCLSIYYATDSSRLTRQNFFIALSVFPRVMRVMPPSVVLDARIDCLACLPPDARDQGGVTRAAGSCAYGIGLANLASPRK